MRSGGTGEAHVTRTTPETMSETPTSSTESAGVSQLQLILAVIFGGAIVTANVTAAKLSFFELPIVGGVAVPAGFVAIAVAFLVSDLMVELYGKDFAHKTVNATVVTLAIAWALVWTSIYLPVAPFFEGQEAFKLTLGSGGSIMVASIITVLISQHIDVNIFHRIRTATGGKHKWVRNLGSTSVSQLVDTVLFITLAFAVFPTFFTGEPVYGMALVSLIVGQYLVKLGVAVLDTPVFYIITSVRTRLMDETEAPPPGNPVQASD